MKLTSCLAQGSGLLWLASRYERKISFHASGTPGRHQWLQSDSEALSLHVPTCASVRNADMEVICRTLTGTFLFFTTSIIVSENRLRSFPLVSNDGCWVTLQYLRVGSLMQKDNKNYQHY